MNDRDEVAAERVRCLAAVAAEPELPGEIPPEMWEALQGDKDATVEALRIVVRLTKSGIASRICEGGGESEILRAAADILYARAAACPPRESWEENFGEDEPEHILYSAAEVARIESETIAKGKT